MSEVSCARLHNSLVVLCLVCYFVDLVVVLELGPIWPIGSLMWDRLTLLSDHAVHGLRLTCSLLELRNSSICLAAVHLRLIVANWSSRA